VTEYSLTVEKGEGTRLDLFLKSRFSGLSRARIQKIIKEGKVLVNGRIYRAGQKLKIGDKVEVRVEEEPSPGLLGPEPVPFEVLYEDDQVVVINKPSGLVVHPGAGVREGTLVHGLIFCYPEIAAVGSPTRPGIVHRLDKETSGVMVVARTEQAYQFLRQQFEDRKVKKTYLALALGKFREKKGLIDLPIGRHVHHRKKISVKTRKPRVALTNYQVLEEFQETTFLVLQPVTGRTHQLRVHLSATGHPLVGDTRYGGGGKKQLQKSPRLFLHAWKLSFQHPSSGQVLEFEAPLPQELNQVLSQERRLKQGLLT